ncbi:AbrB/MazE/SpoVT family DNA-binding domain-containing protein [Nocardia flavorosea]|uniref:AbrB/MazE/SpoVT family DNA-binding domain-containing protein n=1 Tax=Nocardia flavorosea TaxID=53429 RepID=A0A846YGM3_9NOCA|nr:AbrB/MazE/SpoVT family DNA-binding domain-containing protein [Nocardia flavorosea]NKY58796.1 AbrB/MazE/SpoVT family DNA-binding domain-containing protein [Nocardia flavorosea]
MTQEQAASYGPGGRGFYGAVTVSERGQIAIPAQARRDHGIVPGDKLLVLGDPEQGLALMKLEVLLRNLHGSSELLQQILSLSGNAETERKTDHA